jgi:ketosteroid isomerase-like protein
MKKLLMLLAVVFTAQAFAQKDIATVQDTDELTLNVKKLNQTYVENDFSLWNELFADNAVVFINSSKLDKQALIAGFKSHHSIFNNIQIPDITAETKYFTNGDIWTSEWFNWLGTGNKTGIRYSNRANFNYMWKDGKVIMLVCYFDSAALNMELKAQ